jgi:hypothetical protein
VKSTLQILEMKKRALTKGQPVAGQVPGVPAVPAPKPAK